MGLMELGSFMKKTAFFVLISLVATGVFAQPGSSRISQGASQGSGIYPPYFQNLPRTKAGIKRFLLSYCQNHVSLEQIMASSHASGRANPHGRCAGRRGYQLCLALATQNPNRCGELAKGCQSSLIEDCHRDYNAAEFFVKMAGSTEEFMPFCVKAMKQDHMSMPSENMPKACLVLRQAVLNHWTPERFCHNMKPLGLPQCQKNAAFLLGPQACSSGNTDGICEADTAIFKVLSSRNNVEACGSSPICRAAFTHSSKICEEMSGQFALEYCQETAGSQFRKMMAEEKRFRKYNRLPPYKNGDLLINYLPPEKKEKYYNKSLMKKHDQEMMQKYLKHVPPPSSQGEGNAQDSGE